MLDPKTLYIVAALSYLVVAAAIWVGHRGYRLANRRAFYELIAALWARSVRARTPMSVMVVDIDEFKAINDRHGHAAGDAVLRALAEVSRRVLRADDFVARFGGDEFVVALYGTTGSDAVAVAQRLRQSFRMHVVANHLLPAPGGETYPATLSVGIAERSAATVDIDALIQRADGAMYRAKNKGRDTVIVADRESEPARASTPAAQGG